MSLLRNLLTHQGNRWWNLPRTPSQEPNPPHEGVLGGARPVLRRWWTRLTSGDQHATPVYYWWIGIVLGIITGLEVWLFTVSLDRQFLVGIMLALSAIKFGLVISFFMHLRFDNKQYSRIFLACMTLGLAMFISLLLLSQFHGAGA
jgi:cytochrome c oxidase subunit 4